jgi:hypothetical protein
MRHVKCIAGPNLISHVEDIHEGDYLRDRQDRYFRVISVSTAFYPTMIALQSLFDPAAKRFISSEFSLLTDYTVISRATRYAPGTEL